MGPSGARAGAIVTERIALADTLGAVGPDAPTLAGAWTAADVAAHVVSLDRLAGAATFIGRTVVARRAVRLNDATTRLADATIRSVRRKGFDWTVERLRVPPPPLLLRPSVAAVGLFEVFVHHEDVRRASGPAPARAATEELGSALPWLLRYHRRLVRGLRLRVRAAGCPELAAGEGPEVTLDGDLSEVVLWLAGRRPVADVRLGGDQRAVELLLQTPLRI